MKLVNPYHWLYIKIYLQLLGTPNLAFSTVVILSIMASQNLQMFFDIFQLLFNSPILNWSVAHPNNFFLTYCLVFIFNIFYFFRMERYKDILFDLHINHDPKNPYKKTPYIYMPALIYEILSIVGFWFIQSLKKKYGLL